MNCFPVCAVLCPCVSNYDEVETPPWTTMSPWCRLFCFYFLLCKWPFKCDSLQLSSLGDFTPTRVSFSVLRQETLANTPQCRHPVGHLSFVASAANLSGQKQCLDLNVWEIHILILRPLCGWQLVESVWNRKKLGGNVGGKFFFLGDSIVMPVSTCPS